MRQVIELSGKKFGRLLVVDRAANSRRGQARWRCFCDCQAESVVSGYDLRSGNTKSCGCFRRDLTIVRSTIHGRARRDKADKTYAKWKRLRVRKKIEQD